MSRTAKPAKSSARKRSVVEGDTLHLQRAAPQVSAEAPFTLVQGGHAPGVYTRLSNGTQLYICGVMWPLGDSTDVAGRNAGIRVELVDAMRQRRHATISAETLSSPMKTYTFFSALGLHIPVCNAKLHGAAIAQYLFVMGPAKKHITIEGDGWNIVPDPESAQPHAVYALGDRIYQSNHSTLAVCRRESIERPVLYDHDAFDKMLKFIARDHLAVFTVCAAAASVLLRPLCLSAILVFLVGNSSLGKSKLLRFAASLFGPMPMLTWRSTKNGAQAAVRNYQDRVCVIDEVGQSNGAAFAEAAYDLTNDSSKLRATGTGALATTFRNVNVILSGGEETPLSLIRKSGLEVKGGQIARLVSVPVEEPFGVWSVLGDFADGAQKTAAIEQLAHASAGAFAARFCPCVVEQARTLAEDFAYNLDHLEAELSKGIELDGDPIARRVLKDFVLFFYAGLVAREAKAVPWTRSQIAKSIAHAFGLWHRDYLQERPKSDEDVMRRLRLFFQSQRGNQFPPLADHHVQHAGTLAGYEHCFRGEAEASFLVLPAFFEEHICKDLDMKLVLTSLTERGFLRMGSRGAATTQVHMPDSIADNRAFYVIRRAILAD